jgi:sec-independent protein translocase protein TatC
MPSSQHSDDLGGEQPFISHLIELRERLLRMVVAIAIAMLLIFPFANKLYTYVAAPLLAQMPKGTSMIATEVASPFLTPFKLALVAAIFVSMPYLLSQFWAFVAPGLYRHEKRLAMPILVSSVVLFYLGMAFAYYVVFPVVFAFFTHTAPEGVAVMTDISKYLDFVLTLFFAFGVAFEIPVAIVLLVAIGALEPEQLTSKRPYVIVGVFVIGMLLTPPDVISQTLLALPMWGLFELGVLASRFIQPQGGASGEQAEDEPSVQAANGPGPGADVGTTWQGADPDPVAAENAFAEPHVAMTDEEMEAELDRIAAEETMGSAPAGVSNPVDEKLRRIHELRELEQEAEARRLLYEVLEDGDEEQRRVARNILTELDTP